MEYELDVKPRHAIKRRKKKSTKIDDKGLDMRIVDYIAKNKSYPFIARKLVEYVRNRKVDPDPDFALAGQTVKTWWMTNSGRYNDIVNEKRNALATQRAHRYIDKGIKVREDVQKGLESDAKEAANLAESSFDYEATARIREKIVKTQESGERAVAIQSPHLNVTNIIVNPLTPLREKMKKKLDEIEEEDANTIDVEYEDVDDDEEEEEDDDEEDEEDDED